MNIFIDLIAGLALAQTLSLALTHTANRPVPAKVTVNAPAARRTR